VPRGGGHRGGLRQHCAVPAAAVKLLRRLVSLSCLLSLVNSLASATIADKDGSIKASDGETARPLQLHSFGLSELRGAAAGPQLHVPHVFTDADAELRPCDTQERRPPRGGDSMTQGARRTSAARESHGEAADGKLGRLAFVSRREGRNG